jgi:hypothetical protein
LPKDVLYFDNEPTDTVQILNIPTEVCIMWPAMMCINCGIRGLISPLLLPAQATNEELRAMLRKYGEVNALLRDQAGPDTAIVQFEHHAMAAAFYRADGVWWWPSCKHGDIHAMADRDVTRCWIVAGLAVRGQPVRVQVFAALPLRRRGDVDTSRLSKEYRRAQARDAPEKR